MTDGSIRPDTLLCVADGLDVVVVSADEVLIQFGTRSHPSELLRDSDLSGTIGRIFARLLQGPATQETLLEHVPAVHHAGTCALLAALVDRGILSEPRRSAVEQYLRYTFDGEPSTSPARVGLIGAGPLGFRIAENLARQGLARLTLLDDRLTDRAWEAYVPAGVAPKDATRADTAACARLSGSQSLEGALDSEGVQALVRGMDFLVLALEQVDLRTAHLVNRFAIQERKPWLHVTIDGNLGMIGPLFRPPDTACYNDFCTLAVAGTPSVLMARKHREHMLRRSRSSFFAGLPSYAEIVAGYASLAAAHFLLRDTSFALGRLTIIDFEQMQIDVEDVLKLPRCPVCGVGKSAYRTALPVG